MPPSMIMIEAAERLLIPSGNPGQDRRLMRVLRGADRLAGGRGWELHLVGGCVRDWLLGFPSYDIDLVVGPGEGRRVAREVANALGGHYVPLDDQHDIGRAAFSDSITCDFAARVGPELEMDLRSRDLTINAMALPMPDDWDAGWPRTVLIDPVGGLADLRQGLIRPISRQNLVADPLRLVRIYRFAAALGFQVVPEGRQWITELSPLLAKMAAERILKEWGEILKRPGAAKYLRDMSERNLLLSIVPEMAASGIRPRVDRVTGLEIIIEQLPDLFPRHADALQKYLQEIVSAGRPRSVTMKLAALLGELPASGRHSPLESAMRRLTLSVTELKLVLRLVRHHGWPDAQTTGITAPGQIYRFFRSVSPDAPGVLLLSLANHIAGLPTEPAVPEFTRYLLDLYFNPADPVAHPPRWLTGDDLQARFGLQQGPAIGEILESIAEAHAQGEIRTREETLAWASRWLANRGWSSSHP